ncbi:hypothetical protein BJX63DRAFT_427931 [Aspergillus granulosus]|uniref:Uncharacterized protein n=1 Tax=Aspergillus granulosus TaxID=176169 RepID=A0ABR4HYU7_9EURO
MFNDFLVAAHEKILARKGRCKHQMGGSRRVEVRQQCICNFELEPRVDVEIGSSFLGLQGAVMALIDSKGLQSPHDRCAYGNDTPPLGAHPIDLSGGFGSNLEVLGSHAMTLNIISTDMTGQEDLGRPNVQRDICHLYSFCGRLCQQLGREVEARRWNLEPPRHLGKYGPVGLGGRFQECWVYADSLVRALTMLVKRRDQECQWFESGLPELIGLRFEKGASECGVVRCCENKPGLDQ